MCSDVNKDWIHKDQDKDKDQSHKDKDLTYKDSKQKRRQAQHSFFKTVSLNVFKKTLKYKIIQSVTTISIVYTVPLLWQYVNRK